MIINAIDIFSGAGGMSLGAEMAGIKVEIAVEINPFAADTFQANHPNAMVYREDIRAFKVSPPKEYFVIFGGPPCQGFSISNTKTRNLENANVNLFEEFLRLIEEVKPDWFVFENVEGIKSFENGEVLKIIKKKFEDLEYAINDAVLHASDFGVPQNRRRFFLVGNKHSVKFEFPKPEGRRITVKQAISDLPALSNGDSIEQLPYRPCRPSTYAANMRKGSKFSHQNFVTKNEQYVIERYRHIRPGQNWRAIPPELMGNYANTANCHSGIYKRLDPKKPSVVIANYRKNMLIHPFEDRGLSVREAARIQSFPDNFIFKGTLRQQQQQIGNAVPPLLAKAIFSKIVEYAKNMQNGQENR